jgi:hypothetical protein
MKKHLPLALLALTGAATLSYAQNNPLSGLRDAARNAEKNNQTPKDGRSAAEEALKKFYGNSAQVKITGEHEANGVKVYTADVSNSAGKSIAMATEHGDVLETGVPAANNNLPEPVREVTQGLFKTAPSDVDSVERHTYFVTINGGAHNYMLTLDATGRILDIKSPNQLREDAPGNAQTVTGQQKQQIEKLVQQHFPGSSITEVRTAIHHPGYYQVFFNEREGRGYVIINPNNDVAMYYVPRTRNDLPRPVEQTLNTVLKGEQVKSIGLARERVYRVTENVGNDQIVLRVYSNGDVENLSERTEHAITAGHRTGK